MPRPDRGTCGPENSESPTDPMQNFLLSLKLLSLGKSHHSLRLRLEPSQQETASNSASLITEALMCRAPHTGHSPAGRVVWKEAEVEKEREQRRKTGMMDLLIFSSLLAPMFFSCLFLLLHKIAILEVSINCLSSSAIYPSNHLSLYFSSFFHLFCLSPTLQPIRYPLGPNPHHILPGT